jgi:secreted trypsin-like serine protease
MKKLNRVLIPLMLLQSPLLMANDDISTRIVGGEDSVEGKWPWVVSVNAGGFVCGGSLINSNTVLTAAHCLFNSGTPILSSAVTVKVGEYDKKSTPATATTNIINISVHENYDPSNSVSSNDIALLHLATPITEVTPITILDAVKTASAVESEDTVTAMGWGSTVDYSPGQEVQGAFPNILQEVELPLQTDTACTTNAGANFDPTTMICAAPALGGKDSCQGDSGGPLVYNHAGSWKQIGIVSWGAGCASAGNPGVYTRLANYSSWIASVANKLSIGNKLNYPYTPINNTSTQTLQIANNAAETANVTLALSGSDTFSYTQGTCDTILAGTTCPLVITYAPTTTGISQATLSIDSDLADAATLTSSFTGVPVSDISAIAEQANFVSSNTQWFTGGDADWALQENSTILQTATITDNQETVLIAEIMGTGMLSFEWAVSSEENFDYLSLIINGRNINRISGSGEFQAFSYLLTKNTNQVIWRYTKDESEGDGSDQGFVTKVNFEPVSVSNSGGGGGSLLFIFFMPLLLLRKIFTRKTHS